MAQKITCFDVLTKPELEELSHFKRACLTLMLQGKHHNEIAKELDCSVRRVTLHLHYTYQLFNVHNKYQLMSLLFTRRIFNGHLFVS